MKLYEIRGAMLDTLDIFLESEGNALDNENYEDIMLYLKCELKNKSSNFIKYIRNLQLESEMAKQEEQRLSKLRKIKDNKVESLKKYLILTLQSLEIKKLETDLGSYGVRKNPLSVEVLDISKIPKEFLRIKEEVSVDKDKIKEYFSTGQIVEGARLVESFSLQIR